MMKPNLCFFVGADLDSAIPTVALGVFHNADQVCAARTRVRERSIYDDLTDRLVGINGTTTVGDLLDPRTKMSFLYSKSSSRGSQITLRSASGKAPDPPPPFGHVTSAARTTLPAD